MNLNTILKLAAYGVAGVVLLSLVATNAVKVGLLAASAGVWFLADRVL